MSVRLLVLISAVLLTAAPAAHAQGVTNPAENPAPITITIDGQTYHDGRDTLPGYDDDLCTAIPNVQYDFDNDQIQYYDSGGELIDTAHWTEWSRISSYDTWVKQHGGGTPTATPTPAATATPAPTSAAVATPAPTSSAGKSPSSTTKSPANRSGRSRSTTHERTPTKSAAGAGATATPSHRATHARSAPAKHAEASSSRPSSGAAASDPAGGGGGSGTTPPPESSTPVSSAVATPSGGGSVPAAKTKFKLASQTLGGSRDTRLAGAGILVALFALGCLGLVFGEFRHHVFGRPIR